ncbi:hypothetical protein WMF26_41630 [Sorangium sp. So ce185]|uniref:hypothetical protein n=1 Tax=Sorangium sp. So ce185 TaxID=3133287 RepID=UPI003F63492D
MRLPGTIEERLAVIRAGRWKLLRATEIAELEDEGVRVSCSLAGAASCVELRLIPDDVQFLRETTCADFALLLARGDDAFEAHIVELKRSVGTNTWEHVQKQLEWAAVRLLAIAGVVGIRIDGVVAYTAFCNDKLARESSTNPASMKIPLGPSGILASDANVRRRAEARRSWERGSIWMKALGRDVEHRRIRANEVGTTAAGHVACRPRSSPAEGDTTWLFEPVVAG